MPFTGFPAFSDYIFHNYPASDTPLDAAHLQAMEENLAAYVQQVVTALDAYLENLVAGVQNSLSPVTTVGTMGAVLGATQPLTLSAAQDTDLIGTIDTDLTVTIVTPVPSGSSARIMGSQDAVGGHALLITDGITTLPIPIASGANKPFEVLVHSPDGFNIFLSVLGG